MSEQEARDWLKAMRRRKDFDLLDKYSEHREWKSAPEGVVLTAFRTATSPLEQLTHFKHYCKLKGYKL